MIICDTREKKNEHILEYFIRYNIPHRIMKLDVADYVNASNCKIAVDRKQNLEELAKNLMNKNDHARFWREVRRARAAGIKLIVLCEHGKNIRSIKDIADRHSRFSPVSGRNLMDEIYRVQIAYGVEFMFCEKRQTAKRILELIGGDDSAKMPNEDLTFQRRDIIGTTY